MTPPLIMNATALGRRMDGIGAYTLNLLRELAAIDPGQRFIVYLNREAAEHVRDIRFPDRFALRWVSSRLSPDHGSRGHLLRFLFAQYLGVRHPRSTLFATSQIEAILFRRNQIIMVHDVIPLLFPRLHRRQYLYFRYVLRGALSRARWILTPSAHTRDLLVEILRLPEEKIRLIHNGVSLPARKEGRRLRRNEGKYILFSGRNVPMKNLGGLLQAFDLIKDRVPHRVVITGAGNEPPAGNGERGGEYPAGDRVDFRGYVSSEELGTLMERASLLVFPSRYEGFGLPPLEGMARGCPVVVSNVASLPEVCGDAAEYVNPEDVGSIADGIYRVLTDRRLRDRLIRRGMRRASEMPWRESAVKHVEIFRLAAAAGERHLPDGKKEWGGSLLPVQGIS